VRTFLIAARNTILIVDALSEFSHGLREAVFLFVFRRGGESQRSAARIL
jgi:hypothetical protein